MLAAWPNVDVVSPRIHALEPQDALKQFIRAPFALHRRSACSVTKKHIKLPHAHRSYLSFDGFTAPISGRRYSATAFASRWFCTMGGASQSQNAVTSIADIIPVITASR